VLVAGLNRTEAAGGGLSLVCAKDRMVKLSRITGLDGVLPLHRTVGTSSRPVRADLPLAGRGAAS
jgi:hypothetical protein